MVVGSLDCLTDLQGRKKFITEWLLDELGSRDRSTEDFKMDNSSQCDNFRMVFREAMRKLAKNLYSQGYLWGTSGSISVKVKDEPLNILITASGIHKDAVTGEQILLVDANGKKLEDTLHMPSGETMVHSYIYQKAITGCVIHTHSIHSLLFSNKREVTFQNLEILKGLGLKASDRYKLPVLDNDDIQRLSEGVSDTIARGNVGVLVANHGLFVCGSNLLDAKKYVEIIEYLLKYKFLASCRQFQIL